MENNVSRFKNPPFSLALAKADPRNDHDLQTLKVLLTRARVAKDATGAALLRLREVVNAAERANREAQNVVDQAYEDIRSKYESMKLPIPEEFHDSVNCDCSFCKPEGGDRE